MKTLVLMLFFAIAGIFVGRYFFSLPPRVVTNTAYRTVTKTAPPADYASDKSEIIDLRAQLDLARKGVAKSSGHLRDGATVGDTVSPWLNAGALDAYVTRRSCGQQ